MYGPLTREIIVALSGQYPINSHSVRTNGRDMIETRCPMMTSCLHLDPRTSAWISSKLMA